MNEQTSLTQQVQMTYAIRQQWEAHSRASFTLDAERIREIGRTYGMTDIDAERAFSSAHRRDWIDASIFKTSHTPLAKITMQ